MRGDWTDWSWCECRISQNRFPTYISISSLPVCLVSVNQTLMITWRENIKSAHHHPDRNILIAWSKLLQEERTHTRTHVHTHTHTRTHAHTHTHTHRTTVDGHSHKRLERRSQEFANVLTQGQGDRITVSRDAHHSICSTKPAKTQHLETDWTHTHTHTQTNRGAKRDVHIWCSWILCYCSTTQSLEARSFQRKITKSYSTLQIAYMWPLQFRLSNVKTNTLLICNIIW